MKNLHRRIQLLEKRLKHEPILLQMPDGRTETICGRGDYVLDLVLRASRGERTPEIMLVAESVGYTDPSGGHLLDIVQALWEEPGEDAE
jgi:hypothetical protein